MSDSGTITQQFQQASRPGQTSSDRKKPAPFSLRLSAEERAELDRRANGQALGAYIRYQLLGRKAERRRSGHKLIADYEKLALVLAALGQSHLASNMNQMAKAANTGSLPVTLDVVQELLDACAKIREMRELLVAALGVKPEEPE